MCSTLDTNLSPELSRVISNVGKCFVSCLEIKRRVVSFYFLGRIARFDRDSWRNVSSRVVDSLIRDRKYISTHSGHVLSRLSSLAIA